MSPGILGTEVVGSVLLVRLQREAKRNAIDLELAQGIEAALDRLEDDPALRVGVITGTSSVFSAGTDLSAAADLRMPRGGEYGVVRRRRDKPLVAAVEGPALGGGMEIVLVCDLVVASNTATFGLPEAQRGLVPTCGALFRTMETLPRSIAHELLLTGRRLNAARALHYGLVNEVTEPGMALDRALALARDICTCAPGSIAASMTALRELRADQESHGWAATEAALAAVLAGPDAAEGIAAFLERRPPAWTLAITEDDRRTP